MLISMIVICKGRLSFLQRTAPRLVGQSGLQYVLVDYDCPEGCGDWLEQRYPDATVVRVARREFFDPSEARNIGALAARGELFAFSDGDMLYESSFAEDIRAAWEPGNVLLLGSSQGECGFVVMAREDFFRTGGYDQRYTGYGYEDLAMRKSLEVLGLEVKRIWHLKRSHIHHSNDERVKHFEEKDPRVSQRVNARRLAEEPIRLFHRLILDAASGNLSAVLAAACGPLPADGDGPRSEPASATIAKLIRWKQPRQAMLLYATLEEVAAIVEQCPQSEVDGYDCAELASDVPGATWLREPGQGQDRSARYTPLARSAFFSDLHRATCSQAPFDLVVIDSRRSPWHVATDTRFVLRRVSDEATVVWVGYGEAAAAVREFVDAVSSKTIAVVEGTEVALVQLTPALRRRLIEATSAALHRRPRTWPDRWM